MFSSSRRTKSGGLKHKPELLTCGEQVVGDFAPAYYSMNYQSLTQELMANSLLYPLDSSKEV